MSMAVSQETMSEHEEEPQHGRPFGWYGMVFFLASEAVFFANLIAGYLYLRVRSGGVWPPAIEHITRPDPLLTGINTLVLIASSFPMHFAARAISKGDKRGLSIGLALTALLGAIFVTGQIYEYHNNPFGPGDGIFGSTFYTLTGFHGAHVTFGVILLLIMFFRSLRGDFTKEKHFGVNAAEMYWHFVDAVWIVLFLVVYIL